MGANTNTTVREERIMTPNPESPARDGECGAALAAIRKKSDQMAEDDGLWFVAETCAEAYLQQELRKLCALIESLVPGQESPAGAAALDAEETAPGASTERLRDLLTGVPLPLHWQRSHLAGKTVDLKREHWLIGSALSLQGLGLIFGADSRLAHLIVEAINALPELLDQHDEHEHLFDAMWAANMRGCDAWRAAHPGNDLVLPDQAKMVEWMLDEIERLRAIVPEQEGSGLSLPTESEERK